MEQKKKTVQDLQTAINTIQEDLFSIYSELGFKMLTDSDNSLSKESLAQFQSLQTRHTELAESTSKLRQGIDRLAEIARFTRELDRHTAIVNDELNEATQTLGRYVFENYDECYRPFFDTSYEIARDEGAAMMKKQERLNDLKKQYSTASIFSKLSIKTKCMALDASISQHKSKTSKSFREGGLAVLDSGILADRPNLAKPLAEAYQTCIAVKKRLEEDSARASALANEAAAVRKTFMLLGADNNPHRRLGELKDELRAVDVRSQFIATDCGKQVVGMYIADNGQVKQECAVAFDSSPYRSRLEQIASLQMSLFNTKTQALSVTADIQLETLARTVETKKKEITSYKKKISELEEAAATAEKEITLAKQKIATLTAEKETYDQLTGAISETDAAR